MVIISNKIRNLFSRKFFISWRWKLFVILAGISFLPLLLLYNITSQSTQGYYRKERENKLLQTANIIAGNVSKGNYIFDEKAYAQFNTEINDKSKEGNFRVLVLDARGYVVNDSNKTENGKILLVSEVAEALNKNNKATTHKDEKAIYAAASIVDENSQKIGAVLIIASISDLYDSLIDINRTMVLFVILATLVLVIIVFLLSYYLLDPITSFLKIVQKISQGHLGERLPIKGSDEFTELAISFNQMAVQLEQVEKTREEFVSNVSHELKTPLSAIKVLSESILLEENVPISMYTEFLQDINSEIDRMTNIVNDLLNLVKLDRREVLLNIKQMDLNKMIEDIIKRLSPLANQKNIQLVFEEIRKVTLMADEMKLSLAISNLVENGVKYTGEGGIVKVIVDCDHQNAFITVQDTGIGIHEDEQSKIFTRFYRIDKTRDRETGGTGLGLSITHETVLLHHGSIKLTSKENEGTIFVVRIPLYASPQSKETAKVQ